MRQIHSLYAFNRGLISRLGLARFDIKRTALAAEVMTNWIPRVLGSMSIRPGLEYLGRVRSDAKTRMLKFIFATDDTALVELTAAFLRVWIDDELLTRPSVTTTIAGGDFPSLASLNANWTDADEGSAVSDWESPNYMRLVGTGTQRAIRYQQVAVAGANIGVEHGIRVVIERGPVTIRIGTSSTDDSYLNETVLHEGDHSLSIVPTGNFYIQFLSLQIPKVLITSCEIEAAGPVALPTRWTVNDLGNIRYDQSGDILFVACAGFQQRRIMRRGTRPNARSWSVDLFTSDDGPFYVQNTSNLTLTPSALNGNITVNSSRALFRSTHVGALFSLTSVGQAVTTTAAASASPTNSIRVTGVTTDRVFSFEISGDASGSTVDLQRSYDDTTWTSLGGSYSFTADATGTYDDGLDNQIVYYRLNLTTRVAPDSITMSLRIGSGSIRGVVRITDYASPTSVSAEVLTALGGTAANDVWQEGMWSNAAGWPTAVRLHEGRLWWSGANGVWGSVSDAYDSYDETYPGDAGTINRTIGAGPVDTINWIMSNQRMILGAQGAEFSARASSLDEPLTPTNFNLKITSTQGSGPVDPVKIDQSGLFVNRSGAKVFEMSFNPGNYDYSTTNLMELVPEIGLPGIIRMDAHRQPDTRIHCVRSDGVVVMSVHDRSEEVLAWVQIDTDGDIEDVVTLPALDGDLDDRVYYVVKRTIDGSTIRSLEKLAQEVDCRGGDLSYLADCFISFTEAYPKYVFSVPHLPNTPVVVWADGQDIGTDSNGDLIYTVDSTGVLTLNQEVTNLVVGLPLPDGAKFQSAKLGMASQEATSPLNRQKRINKIGLILADYHPQGLKYGPAFDYLDSMPLIEEGTEVGTDVQTDYDQMYIEFPGTWNTDTRLCLVAQYPKPVTVLAATMPMEVNG